MAGRRIRIDKLLVQRGLVPSREQARARIEAGDVTVGGMPVRRPASQVEPDAHIVLGGEDPKYVSRGGLKLEQALDAFAIDCIGRVAIDVGASTGGFTDCVLQRGAARVYAVDVGYGQLAWKLRQDERVVVLERTNIRHLEAERVPDACDLAVIDCSFIGMGKVLPPTARFLGPGADVVALVKPQFEVGRENLGKHGVVRSDAARADAIARVEDEARSLGFEVVDGTDCETHGPKGNVEYLLWMRWPGPPAAEAAEAADTHNEPGDG